MFEYHTERFSNDAAGLSEKDSFCGRMADDGWTIASESIEPGHLKGSQACCLATLCIPLGFAAGRTTGTIVVTFKREGAAANADGHRMTRRAGRSAAARIGNALGRTFASRRTSGRGAGDTSPRTTAPNDPATDALIDRIIGEKQTGLKATTGRCNHCGESTAVDSRFCGHCGNSLQTIRNNTSPL